MARKLNSKEKQIFADKLRKENTPSDDGVSEEFLRRFDEKRDSPLQLTAELAAWLSEGPFGPVIT